MTKCFLACPIGEPSTPTDHHAKFIRKKIIDETLEQLGKLDIEVLRADEVENTGANVMLKIINKIIKCDFMIVDTTDNNPNVFFEMGIGIALNKPIIYLRSKDQCSSNLIPFDLKHFEFVKTPNSLISYEDDFFELQSDISTAQEVLENWLTNVFSGSYDLPFGEINTKSKGDEARQEEVVILTEENVRLKTMLKELELHFTDSEKYGLKELGQYYILKLQRTDELTESKELLRKAFSIGSKLEYELKDHNMAMELYKEILRFDVNNITIMYNLARLRHGLFKSATTLADKQHQRESAISYLEKALLIKPDFRKADELLYTLKKENYD